MSKAIDDMSKEELEAFIASNGGGTASETNSFIKNAGAYLKEHMEIPVGMGGAVAGAMAGSAVMPVVGTAIGGVIGGALGSGVGSGVSDVMAGELVDYGDVGKEMAISAGFDAATFGAAKVLRPIAGVLGASLRSVTDTVIPSSRRRLIDEMPDMNLIDAGTPESMRVTQQFLTQESGAAGLSAVQTGMAHFIRRTAEGIGDIGLFSGAQARNRIAANNKAIHDGVQDLIGEGGTTGQVGEEVFGILETGKKAAIKLYGDGLQSMIDESGSKYVSVAPVANALRAFRKKYQSGLGDNLSKGVGKKADKLLDDLMNSEEVKGLTITTVKKADLKTLVEFQKRVSRMINKVMPNSKNADPNAFRELSELNAMVTKGMATTIESISPNARKTYELMNKTYGETMKGLLPKINSSFVAAAEKADYDTLGRLLVNNTNNSKVGAMMSSIDEAYKTMGKKGVPIGSPKNAKEAKRAVRKAYVANLFKDISEKTDFTTYKKMADAMSHPESVKKAKIIMGEDFGTYKKLLNAISDTSGGNPSMGFGLAMRQKELGSIAQVGAGGATAVTGAFGTMALVLLLPAIASNLATNRNAVNALLGLNAKMSRGLINEESAALAVSNIIKMAVPDSKEREDIGVDLRW